VHKENEILIYYSQSLTTDCGFSPFHPTVASEAFILRNLSTPMPSHYFTKELLQFLRGSFSITTSARFIRCSLSINLVTFLLGLVFCKFSEIFSLILSSNQNNLIFQFFFSAGEPRALFLFLSTYLSHTPPPDVSPCLLLVYSWTPFSSPGRFWTCPIISVRRNLGQSGPAGKPHFVGS
jgi:hypothetical protein